MAKRYQSRELCGSCRHFRLHYWKFGERYLPLELGHCVYPRLKDRRADERCIHWSPAPPDQEEKPQFPLTAPVFCTKMQDNSVDREEYPMSGMQREDGR